MANRAYLYTATKDFSKIRDVSETVSQVPLVYKILLGVNTEMKKSLIWNAEYPIAITADFEAGLNKLNEFYEYLKTQKEIDKEKIEEYQKFTKEFFTEHPDRKADLFYMEAGEVYDLVCGEEWTLEEETDYTFFHTQQVSFHISEILEKRPAKLFEHVETYEWLNEIKENIDTLSPYLTYVTYFSFNNSGKKKE